MRTFAVAIIALLSVSSEGVMLDTERPSRSPRDDEERDAQLRHDFQLNQILAGLAPMTPEALKEFVPKRRSGKASDDEAEEEMRPSGVHDSLSHVLSHFRGMAEEDERADAQAAAKRQMMEQQRIAAVKHFDDEEEADEAKSDKRREARSVSDFMAKIERRADEEMERKE